MRVRLCRIYVEGWTLLWVECYEFMSRSLENFLQFTLMGILVFWACWSGLGGSVCCIRVDAASVGDSDGCGCGCTEWVLNYGLCRVLDVFIYGKNKGHKSPGLSPYVSIYHSFLDRPFLYLSTSLIVLCPRTSSSELGRHSSAFFVIMTRLELKIRPRV